MADILQVSGSSVSVFPGTTVAAPNGLFPTTDRNDGSVYSWASSTSRLTLPSSDLADGYLFVANVEVEVTHNNRCNIVGYFENVSGTGWDVRQPGGGYARDNSEDRVYLTTWCFVDNPTASSVYSFLWYRDTGDGTPAGSVVRSTLQVIPLYYSDAAWYTSNSTTTYGGTTENQITGFTGTDGTNISISSNVVTVTGDNKRYLCLGGQNTIGRGGRTQRWTGFEVDGTTEHASKTCNYFRDTTNDYNGGIHSLLLETVTANRTIEMFCFRGAGVAAGQGGADVDGSTPTSSIYSMLFLELNDDCEVYWSKDDTGGQELALTGPVDINIARSADIDIQDTASFTRASDIAVNCESAMDALMLVNISQARGSGSIGSGSRWTAHAEATLNGTEQTDYFHGNYNRGNQGSQDTHGSSQNFINAIAVTADQDLGVSVQELSGTEGGGGDIETQAGWVGFGLINLDTMEAGTTTITLSGTVDSQASGITGNVEREITSSGTVDSQASGITGTVTREITSSGTLSSAAAGITGAVEREITLSGSLAAASAAISGAVEREVTLSGSLVSGASSVSGDVEREITSSGTVQAQAADVTGNVTVGSVITLSGTVDSQAAGISGAVEREITISGTVDAQAAGISGAVEREITSSGTLAAIAAGIIGTVSISGTVSLSGTLDAQAAGISGAVEREITLSGTPASADAGIGGNVTVAAGTITLSGTVSSGGADVLGDNVVNAQNATITGDITVGAIITLSGTISSGGADVLGDNVVNADDATITGNVTVTGGGGPTTPEIKNIQDAVVLATGGPSTMDALATHYGKTATETVQDAERRWLIAQGATPGQLNDMWVEVFGPTFGTSDYAATYLAYWNSIRP